MQHFKTKQRIADHKAAPNPGKVVRTTSQSTTSILQLPHPPSKIQQTGGVPMFSSKKIKNFDFYPKQTKPSPSKRRGKPKAPKTGTFATAPLLRLSSAKAQGMKGIQRPQTISHGEISLLLSQGRRQGKPLFFLIIHGKIMVFLYFSDLFFLLAYKCVLR